MYPLQFSIGRFQLTIGKHLFVFFALLAFGNVFSQSAPDSIKRTSFGSVVLSRSSVDSGMTQQIVPSDSAKPVALSRDSVRQDTAKAETKAKKHSPLKAALFSLAVPGLGQGYNKKYWKIPIVYAGFGGLSYALYHTASNFHGYRRAYRAQVAEPPDYTASYKGVNDAQTLKSYRDYYKRYLDISIICFALWDVLQIVDATVDAHLFYWNMRDDLSVSWHPTLIAPPTNYSSAATGVQLQFRF